MAASGPQAAGAASGAHSEECNGAQSAQKKEVVAELADVAAKAHSLVAAEYAGITVAQMTAMRKKARQNGRLLARLSRTRWRRAPSKAPDYACVKDALTVRCCTRSRRKIPALPVGLIKDFAKGNDKLKAKLVAIGGKAVPGVACRRPGLAADPRSGAGHAGPRAGAARDDVRPRAFGAAPPRSRG